MKEVINTNYSENIDSTVKDRQEYIDGIEKIISERCKDAAKKRLEYTKDIFDDPDKYREELKEFLGWPLNQKRPDALPETSSEFLYEEDGYKVYRMKFEIIDGLKLTGLFFKVQTEEKRPFLIVQHGGGGTPERMSGIYGDTRNYNDLTQRVLKHKVHVFAPQVLLWKKDEYGVEYDRKEVDAKLKRVGSSISALEIYAFERVIDYFEKQDYTDKIGMVGLSYGGFFTLYLSALDTRIKSAVSCSYFSTRDAYPWADWTWRDYAYKFDDAEIACMIYPRHFAIEVGRNDALFNINKSIESEKRLKKLCEKVGTDWYDYYIFEGVHEFCPDDTHINNMINDLTK